MNKQAIVGVFTLLGIGVIFGLFYVLSDFGTRAAGYKVGVHFESAAGLRPGAVAYLSGVPVGTIDQIQLLPDFTVDVIVAVRKKVDIPKSSRFIINAPLTGDPILLIVPPRKPDASLAILPRQVLPLSDQPQGTNPATLEDLLEQGQGEIKKVDQLLDAMTQNAPHLLGSLQTTLNNANQLTVKANSAFDTFTTGAHASATQLQYSLGHISRNFDDMSTTLNVTVKRNSKHFDNLIAALTHASASLASTIDSLHEITADPRMHENIIETAKSLANTSSALAGIVGDIHQVSGNPQTQAEMRDVFTNLDASTQKLNSLLGSLGGTSVPVRASGPPGATLLPPGASLPSGTPLPAGAPVPQETPSLPQRSQSELPPAVRRKLGELAKSLISVQVRVDELDKQSTPTARAGSGSPLLTQDRGPQTDFNLLIAPHHSMSLLAGANDIGAQTSYNFLGEGALGGLQVGGGVLYSRLGMLAAGQNKVLGFETRLYDLRSPTLDAYGRFVAIPHLELFGGERDVLHADRRTVFGLQATLP